MKYSKWARWDLHVHTPYSFLNNNFGNNWDDYIKALYTKALEKEVAVIGITDYFISDGYFKIKEEYLANDAKLLELFGSKEVVDKIKKIKLLLNVEFRLNKFIGRDASRLNFHIIFSDDLTKETIQDNFLYEIDFKYEATAGVNAEKRKLKLSNIIDYGKKLQSEHENFREKSELYVGMMNVVVDEEHLLEKLNNRNSIFANKFIVGVDPDEDLSSCSWNGGDHGTRKELIQKAHFFFARNEKTVEWALGLKHTTTKEFIKEFKGLKPCFGGSDSHSIEDLFKDPNGKHTWIKSMPTFNGLMQTIFEPALRVKLSPKNPNEKMDFSQIEKVRYVDSLGRFTGEWIELSSDLNAIIGGKSSGKSMLLSFIARTINPKIVSKIQQESKGVADYQIENLDFEVAWKDGHVERLSDPKSERKILFIPQLYINKMIESNDSVVLQDIILDVLMQNSNFKEKYDTFLMANTKNVESISRNIENISTELKKIKMATSALEILGDEDALSKEVEKREEELKKIIIDSKLTEEEVKIREELEGKILDLTKKIQLLDRNINIKTKLIFKFKENFREKVESVIQKTKSEIIDLDFDDSNVLEGCSLLDEFSTYYNDRVQNFVIKLNEDIQNENQEKLVMSRTLEGYTENLFKINQKQNNGQIIQEQKDVLLKLKSNLNSAKENNDIVVKTNKVLAELIDAILKNYEEMRCNYINFKKILDSSDLNKIGENITLKVEIREDLSSFEEKFLNSIDGRKGKDFVNSLNIKEMHDRDADFYNFLSAFKFEGLLKSILFEEGYLKKNHDISMALQGLFQSYLYFKFDLESYGDPLSRMSPGKRGMVILQMIIQMAESHFPILIDQPEDNLDNRTIYSELTSFLREKKHRRQILIVTHNPNLVVSTDSECVIVCNQTGQGGEGEQLSDSKKFNIVYGGLENSFLSKTIHGDVLSRQGIKEHVCEILEGGEDAFIQRQKKYSF